MGKGPTLVLILQDRQIKAKALTGVLERFAEVGYEAPSARIFDQMQNALEEVVLSLGPADVDNGGILEPRPGRG